MESKFSIVITIDGALSVAKIQEALRRYADQFDGNHSTAPLTGKATAAPKTDAEGVNTGMTVSAPAAKAKPAKAKPAPKAEELDEAIGDEGDDPFGEDEDLAGEVELTLADHVLPAFKARMAERTKTVGADKARAEIANLMKTKFGVASGKVTELPSKHFKAAMEAIK